MTEEELIQSIKEKIIKANELKKKYEEINLEIKLDCDKLLGSKKSIKNSSIEIKKSSDYKKIKIDETKFKELLRSNSLFKEFVFQSLDLTILKEAASLKAIKTIFPSIADALKIEELVKGNITYKLTEA